MKTAKKVLLIVLTLCALTAFFSVSAWAEELVITPSDETMYAGKSYILTVNDPEDTETPHFAWDTVGCGIEPLHWHDESIKSFDYRLSIDQNVSYISVRFYNDPENGGLTENEATFEKNIIIPAVSANVTCDKPSVMVNETCTFSVDNPGVTVTGWYPSAGSIASDGTFSCNLAGDVTVGATGINAAGDAVEITAKTITVNAPAPAEPAFSISASANSYTTGISSPITLSAENKQNWNESYYVNWTFDSMGDIAGSFSSNVGDSVYAGFTTAGKAVIKAYVVFNGKQVWASNNIEIAVNSPSITVSPSSLNIVSGNSEYIKADLTNVPAGTAINWASSGNITLENSASYSGSYIRVTAKPGLTIAENAYITATINGTNVSGQCTVTITPNGVKNISLESTDYYPKVGDTITVTAVINYGAAGEQVTWSYDSNIFSKVSSDGNQLVLRAIRNGSTKVYAYASGNTDRFIDIKVGSATPAITHQITYGNYSTFDGKNPLYFVTNDRYENFRSVWIDGYQLAQNNQFYVSNKEGYILVAINPTYLNMLSSANYHTIQIVSANGTATGYFRNYAVAQTIYGVRTGDENNIGLWAALCLTGFAGAAAIVIIKRKEIFGR